MSINQLQAAGAKLGKIQPPVETPKSLPDPGDMNLDAIDQTQPDPKPDFNEKHRDEDDKSYSSGIAGPKGDYAPPTTEELGMPAATMPHKGGESVVLKALDDTFKDDDYVATFEKPKTSPAAFEPQSTFLTSPYLHFGALSVRYVRCKDCVLALILLTHKLVLPQNRRTHRTTKENKETLLNTTRELDRPAPLQRYVFCRPSRLGLEFRADL